jgi:hypothetical protein
MIPKVFNIFQWIPKHLRRRCGPANFKDFKSFQTISTLLQRVSKYVTRFQRISKSWKATSPTAPPPDTQTSLSHAGLFYMYNLADATTTTASLPTPSASQASSLVAAQQAAWACA